MEFTDLYSRQNELTHKWPLDPRVTQEPENFLLAVITNKDNLSPLLGLAQA